VPREINMKEIRVSLQKLCLKYPGTYFFSFYFDVGKEQVETQVQGDAKFQCEKDGKQWVLGPIVNCGPNDVMNDLQEVDFVVGVTGEFGGYKTTIHVGIYQEVPVSEPSSSHFRRDEMNRVLFGKGALKIAFPQAWHTSVTEFDDKTYYQRVYFNAVHDVGSIKYNLGWLGMKAVFQESAAKAAVYEISDEINIHQDPPMLHKDVNEALDNEIQSSKKPDLVVDFDKLKSPSFNKFEVNEILPSVDAIQQILPVYSKLVSQPPQRTDSVKPYLPVDEPEQAIAPRSDVQSSSASDKNNLKVSLGMEEIRSLDGHVVSVLEYQSKELDRYREAVRQMGELIISLRNQMSELQAKNNQLRSELFYFDASNHGKRQEAGSHSELQKSLIEQIEEQKIMIQKQQNDLIIKNEYEKKYLKLVKAHQSQQSLLQDYQAKMSKYQRLEKICKKQEQIIVEYEANAAKSNRGQLISTENAIVKPLNVTFKDDMVSNRNTSLVPRQVLPQTQLTKLNFDQVDEIEERVVLLQKLEKAEGRIMALEKQMFDNARTWAREKSHLKVKTAEGFPDMIELNRSIPAPLSMRGNQMDHLNQRLYQFPYLKEQDLYNRFSQL